MLLLFFVLSFSSILSAQLCSPLYFEVCRILPDVNSYPSNPINPGPFHGYYKVKLKSTAGLLPTAWNVNYLAFNGKISVNEFTSRINLDLTKLYSQTILGSANPYYQYLNVTEDGQVDWTVGSVSSCNQGEQGVVLPIQDGLTEIELFTIVVDGVPGDFVNFSGDNPNANWVGDVKDCNYYHCSGTIPVLGCTNPANFLIPFPTPLTCNPSRNVTFDLVQIPLGPKIIQVTLNNLNVMESVRKTDMVLHIVPHMNGINNLELTPFQPAGGPPVKFWVRNNMDGSKDIYVSVGFFAANNSSQAILGLIIEGQFNLSQGATLNCGMFPGRGGFSFNGSPNSTCSLTGVSLDIVIPGFAACSSVINVSPTRYTGPGCTLGVKYTIRHNEPNPINLTYLKLLFAFKLTNGNNSPGSPTTTLPCPSCGSLTYNATADTWEYLYEQNIALSLPNISEVLVPFNINIDCISYYVILAEATPSGGSICALGVTFDINQWPACDPSVKGSINVDKGGAAALAPLYKVTLESNSDPSYFMVNDEDCKADYSFCPDPVKAPFQIRLASSSPNIYLCGVTTYDLVVISKHLLGIAPITEPKTLIAADASLLPLNIPPPSGLSTFDIAQIRKCILGIEPNFGPYSAPSWWYFRDGYTFKPLPDLFDPPYAGSNISPVPANGLGSYGDFFAIKVGDVNHTCDCGMRPGGNESVRPFLKVSTSNIRREGNNVYVPVWSDAPFNLIAVQAGFRFDPSDLTLKAVIPNPELEINDFNFGVNNSTKGELRFAWSPFDGQTPLPKQALLFTLQFELKGEFDLPSGPLFWTSEDILQNLVYQEDGSEFPTRLNWEERSRERSPSLALVVSPNPFEERMMAFVYVEKPVKATISLTDGKGFTYSQQTVELQSGDNTVEVQTSASTQPGVYFLSIVADGQRIQRRVVKI